MFLYDIYGIILEFTISGRVQY